MKKILFGFAAFLLIVAASPVVGRAQQSQNDPQSQGQYDNGGQWPQDEGSLPPYPNQAPPPPGQGIPYPQQGQPQQGQAGPPPGPQGQAGPPPGPNGQAAQEQQQTAGQPQPGVARLSYIHGDVSQQRGDNGEWVASTLNTPVEPGDRVTTGEGARAELQLDYADVLRMSNNVTANVVALTRNNIQVQVGQGLTTFSVLKGSEAQSEIDTPNAAIRPLGEGEYRILVNSNAETQVVVRNGSVEISTPQGTTRVDKGQMITIAGTDNPQYKTDPAPGRDEWDSWNNDRDKRIMDAQSWQHTDRYYTGSEDLDQYGTWSNVPDYGQVWTPSVQDPNWVPYRDGRWVWEPYYGWTWVSYEPWGWAPYHYGRWFVNGGSWAWWPGPLVTYPSYYPIWAPAYVSFFGFGGGGWGVNFGFGFGGWGRVGWLPVGPGDWYHPWYGGWGGRYNAVGVGEFGRFHEGFSPLGNGRFSTFNSAFSNDRVRGGFSSMAGNEFGRGAVSRNQERISEASFRQASAMTGRMPVNPSRESFSPSGRGASPSTIRGGAAGSQHFFSSNREGFSGAANRGESGFGANRSGSFANGSRGFEGNTANRGSAGGNAQGWHSFTAPQGGNRGTGSFSQAERGNNARGYSPNASERQFSSPNTASRGGYGGSSNSYTRPPLNMSQPIVTPRGGYNQSSRGTYNGGSYGARSGESRGYSGGSYGGQSRGNYSAPRSYSAPQGGGGSRGGGYSGGGAYRGGGGGGGSYHGGGGGSRGGSSHSSGGHGSHR
jgi:hypothetical protein